MIMTSAPDKPSCEQVHCIAWNKQRLFADDTCFHTEVEAREEPARLVNNDLTAI